ncbi:MAG: hypothetical protein H0T42_04275 [Deltaproteobacteria bacterium]|nr:hypothetical protein [Deltaproteobacteria bacterium]
MTRLPIRLLLLIVFGMSSVASVAPASAEPAAKKLTLAQLRSGVAKAKAKWVGQRVRIAGTLSGFGSSTDNTSGKTSTYVRINGLKDPSDRDLTCRVEGALAGDGFTLGKARVTIEGTVVSERTLSDCTATLAKR